MRYEMPRLTIILKTAVYVMACIYARYAADETGPAGVRDACSIPLQSTTVKLKHFRCRGVRRRISKGEEVEEMLL